MIHPLLSESSRTAYSVYEDSAGDTLFGTSDAVGTKKHYLAYRPMRPTSEETFTDILPDARRPLFLCYKSGTNLKLIKNAKFPRLVYDEDTDDVMLYYWTNVPYENLSNPVYDKFSILGTSDEPLSSDGSDIDDTLQRVMACARGSFYDLYDNIEGDIKSRRHLIFERPQRYITPTKWVAGNDAEPVLDIHPPADPPAVITLFDTKEGTQVSINIQANQEYAYTDVTLTLSSPVSTIGLLGICMNTFTLYRDLSLVVLDPEADFEFWVAMSLYLTTGNGEQYVDEIVWNRMEQTLEYGGDDAGLDVGDLYSKMEGYVFLPLSKSTGPYTGVRCTFRDVWGFTGEGPKDGTATATFTFDGVLKYGFVAPTSILP